MYIKYIFVFCLLIGCALAENANTPKATEDVSKTITPSEDKSKSKTTTHSPPTTSIPTSTNTPTPSTSTIDPTSSTTPSTPTPPTTPTPAPTTPTPASTTPTSAPTTPTPPSPPNVWTVTDSSNNITCIVAKMDIDLVIHYEGNQTQNFSANPHSAVAKGECNENIQTLDILGNRLSLLFTFNGTDKKYFINSLAMSLVLDLTNIVKYTENVTLYETGKNTSYSCPSYDLNFKPDNTTTITLNMNNIQIEAFRSSNTTKFSSATHCSGGEVPDIVPLVVGLALAGLVVVVVIGYFIGRRRSQARGYLSM